MCCTWFGLLCLLYIPQFYFLKFLNKSGLLLYGSNELTVFAAKANVFIFRKLLIGVIMLTHVFITQKTEVVSKLLKYNINNTGPYEPEASVCM